MHVKCFGLLAPPLRAIRSRVSTKIGLVMKLTAVLFLALVLQVSAKTLAQTVTFSGKAVPLQTVFTAIRSQTGYKFFYRNEDLVNAPAVSVQLKNAGLEQALTVILAGQQLGFSIEGKTIFISKKIPVIVMDAPRAVDPGDVSGVVRDSKGRAIPGVTVVAKHSHVITATNDQGVFTFRFLQPNDTLMFTSISYESISTPASHSFMTIVMKDGVTALAAVSVAYNTGYQTLSAERATGSFGKPDMKVFQDRVGTQDLMSRLEGQIAGFTVASGNDAMLVDINGSGKSQGKALMRGEATTIGGGEQPLLVLNGVVVKDFSSINVNDVEDITVLKDAAAAAIWGAKATNGVVVVTTKEGKRNQRLTVSYSGSMNYQGKPDFSYAPKMSSKQYIEAAREVFDPQAYPYSSLTYNTVAPHNQILYDAYLGKITQGQADAMLDSLAGINNWAQMKDLLFANAFTTNHSLSVSGGTNNYSFYATLGYAGSQANTPGTHSNAYHISMSQNVHIGNRVNVGLTTSIINNVSSANNFISADPSFLPYQLFRDSHGNSLNMNYLYGISDSLRLDYGARSRINTDYNPLNERSLGYSKNNNLNLNATANIGVKLWKGLSFQGTYGYIKGPGTGSYYTDNKALSQRKQIIAFTVAPTVGSTPVYYLPLNGGNYSRNNYDQRNWTVRNQLVYMATPRKGEDNITLQVGQEALEDFGERAQTSLYGYDNQLGTSALIDYKTLSQGIFGTVSGYGFLYAQPYMLNQTLSRYSSYFALGSYTYSGKYSVDLSWRRDHSNLFGSDVSAQNKPTWSMGGRWQLSKEPFMMPVKWVNDMGLRVTYGITGNSPYVGAASYQDVLSAYPAASSGSVAGDALLLSSPANRTVTWESTKTTNIAVDYAVLNRRISGTIEVYQRNTDGLLASVPVNPFSGATSLLGNLGRFSNKGLEVTLRTENIRGDHFSWSTTLVFAYNKNKFISQGVPSPYQTTLSYIMSSQYVAGYASMPMFAYHFAGLDNVGDPQIRLKDKTVTKTPNVATPDDITYKGSMTPPVTGGFSNTFRYNAFSLSANMIYKFGGVMRKPVNQFTSGILGASSSFSGDNFSPAFLDRWKQPGDEKKTNIPSYVADSYTAYTRRDYSYYTNADINVISSSYIKLRDITLGYDLPSHLLNRLRVQRLNVFGQVTNFMVWRANHDHVDPEYQTPSYADWGTAPFKHAWNCGVNVTF
jgi:TonB-linked SusC/RagA family outer membrane protein